MNDREIVRNTCLTSLSIIRILFVNSPNDKDTKDLIWYFCKTDTPFTSQGKEWTVKNQKPQVFYLWEFS